jgi:hypothetical protein
MGRERSSGKDSNTRFRTLDYMDDDPKIDLIALLRSLVSHFNFSVKLPGQISRSNFSATSTTRSIQLPGHFNFPVILLPGQIRTSRPNQLHSHFICKVTQLPGQINFPGKSTSRSLRFLVRIFLVKSLTHRAAQSLHSPVRSFSVKSSS